MHGLFGMLDNWNTIAKKLAEQMPIHLLDLRNHGRSFHKNEMTYAAMADDVLEYMDVKGLGEANFVGHSMGGKVALNIAKEYPYVVNKLVVADMAMRSYPVKHRFIIEAMESLDLHASSERKDLQTQLEQQLKAYPGLAPFLMKSIYRKNQHFAFRFNLSVLSEQLENLGQEVIFNQQFEKPVLYIRGIRSDYVNEQDIKAAKKIFPRFEHIDLDASHWVHAEQPAAFIAALEHFL